MYTKITLEKFEVLSHCCLREDQVSAVREEIEYYIGVLNEGIEEGRDYLLDHYMQTYDSELKGMGRICSKVGIHIKINKSKED